MPYLFYLPSLLCGLAISVEDARDRRVRLSWIFAGSLAQLISDIIAAAMANSFFQILQAVLFTALCAGVLALLSVVKAGGVNGLDALAMPPRTRRGHARSAGHTRVVARHRNTGAAVHLVLEPFRR